MNDVDVVRLHLNDLNKVKMLTPEEEIELAKKAKNGDMEARNRILTANMRFVVNVAKKYQNRGLELEDLISEGYIGLIEALDKFDVDRGYHFISYAVWWIRQSILKAISEKSRAIRLPMNKTNELAQIEKAKRVVSSNGKKSEEKEFDEIAKMLGMTKYHVREMMNISQEMLSLDAPLSGNDSEKGTFGDVVPCTTYTDPVDDIMDMSLKDSIQMVLDTLDEKSAKVLTMRYGLDGNESMSLQEIGEYFNVTKERIRQIEKKALFKISNSSRKDVLKDFA